MEQGRMNAGRELDAEVAEKVMGLEVEQRWILLAYYELEEEVSDELTAEQPTGWDNRGIERDYVVPAPPEGLGGDRWKRCPAYSTDIAAAWTVVEKLEADGEYGLVIHSPKDCYCAVGGSAAGWAVEVDKEHWTHLDRVWVRADTAPLAIVKAALAACGVEIPA